MMYKYVVFVICAVVSADKVAVKKERKGFVGFFASLNAVTSFTSGQTVMYPNVVTNAGNSYDPSTGVFTAPRTGYYLFHIHATGNGATGFWFQLVHNGIPRFSIHGNPQTAWAMGGNSALLKVNAGDRVYVKAVHSTSIVYGDGTQHFTTFTGHLAGQ